MGITDIFTGSQRFFKHGKRLSRRTGGEDRYAQPFLCRHMRWLIDMKVIDPDQDQAAHSKPETQAQKYIEIDITDMNGTEPPVSKLYDAYKPGDDQDEQHEFFP